MQDTNRKVVEETLLALAAERAGKPVPAEGLSPEARQALASRAARQESDNWWD